MSASAQAQQTAGEVNRIRLLPKRWWLVVLCTLLAMGAAAAVTLTARPVYTAHAQLFVSAAPDGVTNAYQGAQFVQQQVRSYADIVNSPAVTAPVIAKLGLNESPGKLATQIRSSVPLDTVLINISVNDRSPAAAGDIANAVAAQFAVVVGQLEKPLAGGPPRVKVSVVEAAQTPTSPSSPRIPMNLAVGAVIGVTVGLGAMLLRTRLDAADKDVTLTGTGQPASTNRATDAARAI